MKITAIKTRKITKKDTNILSILDTYLPHLKEKSIVVIASKIIAICQGNILSVSPEKIEEVIKQSADVYLPKEANKYNLYITIKNNYLTYSSGIDQSNIEEGYVLWPSNPQTEANTIRNYLKQKFSLKNVGVIITDMAAIPLQRGIIGGAIAYSGFKPLKDLTNTPDIFGKPFKYTQMGIYNGLAAAAAVVMGEGAEQTPLGLIDEIPFVEFVDKNPSEKELSELRIPPDEDLYGPMLQSLHWEKDKK